METGFFEKVYDIVRQIPYGRVTTYGIIAAHIGSPQAARMVGWALNKSAGEKEFIPAHRVVNRKGLLTGKHYFANENTMKEMLESEGIKIIDNQIQNFKDLLWHPDSY
ncbi:MAG: MGMT family protein [Bacteroidales bacterium]|nr:MGMT family protein [Bacteroidales bacterium]